jgi:hypothetical protein
MGLVHNNVNTFNRALTAFAQEVGYTIEYAALREAALMCRDAIIFTPPLQGWRRRRRNQAGRASGPPRRRAGHQLPVRG